MGGPDAQLSKVPQRLIWDIGLMVDEDEARLAGDVYPKPSYHRVYPQTLLLPWKILVLEF